MYGIAKDTDFSFLIDEEVTQICIGKYQSTLQLSGDASILLECIFKVSQPNECSSEIFSLQSDQARLLKLLGSKVISVLINENGILIMNFSNQTALSIFDSNSEFESYQINKDEINIVV